MAKKVTKSASKKAEAKRETRKTISLDKATYAKLSALKEGFQCDWNQLMAVLHTQAQARKVEVLGKGAVENLIVEMLEFKSPEKITTQFIFLELKVNRTNIKKVMVMYQDRIEAHNKGK